MTKKKKIEGQKYSRLELAQYRLRKIALEIEMSPELDVGTSAFIINAFRKIGNGEDANSVLGVKARRGEKKTQQSKWREFRRDLVLGWIAATIQPEPEGFGYSLDEAIEIAAAWVYSNEDGLTEETLRNYWNNNPEKHSPTFEAPIGSLPIKRP